jgi:hypothetical protein
MIKGIFLFSALSLLINFNLFSQDSRQKIKYSPASAAPGETIKLFTDRNIYCVQEKIYFTAGYSCIKEFDSLSWSNVLYVELIKWNGVRLIQMKLRLTNDGTSGNILIPDMLLSGNYYLRAYTKWMRNFSAYEYAYIPVKIVNPFRSEIDEGPSEISDSAHKAADEQEGRTMVKSITCTPEKKEYSQREKAVVEIQLNRGDPKVSRYCVSVARVPAVDTTMKHRKPEPLSPGNNLSYIKYLPEIRGITITGNVIDKTANKSPKDLLVSLSETTNGEYFSVYHTIDSGSFVFSLPDMQGLHDFFIQTENTSSKTYEITIDDGFCNQPVKLPYVAFSLDEHELDYSKELLINHQLSERFRSNNDLLSTSKYADSKAPVFYGSRKASYYTEKYIELPNIEEFINEIITEATIMDEKGKSSFISLRRKDMLFHAPLILLDNVMIDNDERLLKIPLNRINHVEVINMDYAVTGIKYDGIISIYSRNKDFAGLELNKNSMFFTNELFSYTEPGFDFGKGSDDSRIPDRRNLLYWNPDIRLSTDRETNISFYTSDIKGDYVVYIRGINIKDDSEIYGTCYFSVN